MKVEKFRDFSIIDEPINESFWEDIKYGISKVTGRYKAGGKIFGKGKVTKEAEKEIGEVLKKESNKLLKKVVDQVEEAAPGFPNNRKKIGFLRGIILFGQFYDSIVAATKKSPKEEGYMAPDVANQIISDMQKVVKKYLDVDLKAMYSTFESASDELTDDEILELFEYDESVESLNEEEEFFKKLKQLKDKAMDKMFGAKKGEDAEQKKTRGQSAKLQQTSGKSNVESERMKTLQSNKLPLILAGVGGALGALGWLAQTEWMKDWIIKLFGGDYTKYSTEQIVSEFSGGKPDSKGLVHWMSQISEAQGGGPIKTGGDVTNFMNQFGGTKNMSGFFIGNGGGDAMQQAEMLQKVCSANPSAGVWEIFTKAKGMAGTMKGGQNLFGISGKANFVGQTIKTEVTKQAVKGTGTAIAAKVAGIGKIMTGVGIALVATGALVKLLREKGQRQSRAKTLNDLLQSLVPVKVETGSGVGETGGGETSKEDRKEGQKEVEAPSEKSIYPLMIKNLKALNSLIISSKGVKLEGEESGKAGEGSKVGGGKVKKTSRETVKESMILRFDELILEKEFSKDPRNVQVMKNEDFLTQAVKKVRKALSSLTDEKDKGIGINDKFLGDILSKKMDTTTKEPVKELYKEVYDYIYGAKSKTISDSGPLYKESVEIIANKAKRQTTAEKIARFANLSMKFEKEGFYSGLGEFGKDMEEFNTTLNQIMEYFKNSESKKESKILRFSNYLKS